MFTCANRCSSPGNSATDSATLMATDVRPQIVRHHFQVSVHSRTSMSDAANAANTRYWPISVAARMPPP
jgi:hypothetical protein